MKPERLFASYPFLLEGIDCDGESRASHHDTLADAVESGRRCIRPDDSGPPWQSFAVWGNDPVTEEWKTLHEQTNTVKIIAYTYEADMHCVPCAVKRFAALATQPEFKDEHGLDENQCDNEGNEIHPVFSTDEQLEPLHCGDCLEKIT